MESTKTVHLIGIAGIGMSAVAEILKQRQHIVQGSDLQSNSITKRLEQMGITIFRNHDSSNITKAVQLIIVSSSISMENLEVQEGLKLGIEVIKRGDMLARLIGSQSCIVVSGAHGKTSTTGLIGHLLNTAQLKPTIINGGVMSNYGSNVLLPSSSDLGSSSDQFKNWFVVEGDESDGTMLKLPRTICVVTNIDLEHMEYYRSEENLVRSFIEFVQSTIIGKSNTLAILCVDSPRVQKVLSHFVKSKLDTSNIVTYGLKLENYDIEVDILGQNIHVSPDGKGMCFDVQFRHKNMDRITWKNIFIPLHGQYNVQNFLVTVAVANYFQISEEILRKAASLYLGIDRRFTITGITKNGVTIVDDYSHHPIEIQATLAAARSLLQNSKSNGRLIAIHQPHRYSRVQLTHEEYTTCFSNADLVILTPIYSAGEEPLPNVNSPNLAACINAKMASSGSEKQNFAQSVQSFEEAIDLVRDFCQNGDVIICCGAGTITDLAHTLPACFL